MSQSLLVPNLVHNPTVSLVNGNLTTSSLNVAEVFEKEHKNVLRDISNLTAEIPQDLRELNFELSNYESKSGKNTTKQLPMYTLTQDAFTLLVMGYTGKKAMQFKIAYIQEFNAMREQLNNQPLTLSSIEDRRPLTELINVWGKLNHNKYATCRKELNAHFQIKKIEQLPIAWIPDAMAWVQGRIDATQMTLPTIQDSLVHVTKKKKRILPNNPLLDALVTHYDLEGYEAINICSYKLKEILDQYPDVGEHTLNAILLKAKYITAVRKMYNLGQDIQKDLLKISSIPIANAREKVKTTDKNMCLDSFTYTMHATNYNFADLAKKFSDDFYHTTNFYICLAMMQDL